MKLASDIDDNCDDEDGLYELVKVDGGVNIVIARIDVCLESDGIEGNAPSFEICEDGNSNQVFNIINEAPFVLIRNSNGQFLNKIETLVIITFSNKTSDIRNFLLLNTCVFD